MTFFTLMNPDQFHSDLTTVVIKVFTGVHATCKLQMDASISISRTYRSRKRTKKGQNWRFLYLRTNFGANSRQKNSASSPRPPHPVITYFRFIVISMHQHQGTAHLHIICIFFANTRNLDNFWKQLSMVRVKNPDVRNHFFQFSVQFWCFFVLFGAFKGYQGLGIRWSSQNRQKK